MKIGVYDPYLDTMSGGEKYMLTAALSLSKEHEVTIFWDESEKEQIVEKAKKRFGINLDHFVFKNSIFSRNISFLTKIRESKKYDAIFLLSDGSIPFVACQMVIHFQSPMEWVSSRSPIIRLKLGRISKFICNSEFTKSYIDKEFKIDSTVVYPPVTIQKPYSQKEKLEKILHVGRFGVISNGSSYKKQDILAETFSEMVNKGLKNWKLVFVMSVMDPDLEDAKEFQDKYKSLPIEFVINPTNEQLWKEYTEAGIYWHASGFGEDLTLHPDRAEHFGISTVEAMGAGAVPVVFEAGGQKEIVRDGENGFLWRTKKELADITIEIIRDEKKRKKISAEAVKSAETYSISTFEEKFLKLFS